MDQPQPEQSAPTPLPTGEAPKEDEDSTDLPAIQTKSISALLPISNDRVNLQSSLESWISVLNNLNRDYEIILVDDVSNDGTLDLAQSLAEKNPRVRLLRHDRRCGFGACLRTGLAAAQFPLLLISTCDGRYQPAEITHLLQWIDKVHLVAGYRTVASKRFKRNWPERIFRWIIRIIFGLRLKDPECWFLLARHSIFERIPVQSTGPFAFAEILAKANFLGCLMSEVSVSYNPAPEADAKWSNISLREKLAGFRQIFSHPEFRPPKP
ncbi:MAG TPA: glycosyltransferase family 2 protein [Gemmataceae bacterium]|nr:glycosyltransferase family 2 protein [Gemmataceae bacterium]